MKDIRNEWISFYKSLGYASIKSAPLIHPLFPLSFNMSAGLVQLDPLIRGKQKIDLLKQCVIQKCFRYFDLDKIGDDTHLSFFEMAGAFEIGKFEDKETIERLYFFLTNILGINPEKLFITSFDQDQIANKKIVLDSHLKDFLTSLVGKRVIYGSEETNFWKQGGGAVFMDNMRLCGPSIEFFYDLGKKDCTNDKCNPFCSCGRFIEISNILLIKHYIDHNQAPEIKDLINPATEVVIGVERLSQIIENKKNVFQTSSFEPLINILSLAADKIDVRIIVDHIKSLCFILSEEKIYPGKNGRNRIIRTLIRNLLTSFYLLNLPVEKYLSILIDEVIALYIDEYPEINNAKNNVLEIVSEHKIVFDKTIEKAKRKINDYIVKNHITKIGNSEKEYFKLHFGLSSKLTDYFFQQYIT
jgi:alanyl-tRNA synthetase